MSDPVKRYTELIQKFVKDEIDVHTFERTYLQVFKAETVMLPTDVFEVLDQLFAEVDAFFCPDPTCRGKMIWTSNNCVPNLMTHYENFS